MFPNWTVKLYIDRLKLLALFDRNATPFSSVFDVCFAVLGDFKSLL